MSRNRFVLVLAVLLAAAVPAAAQDAGSVDIRESVNQRIRELESQIGGDTAAEKQAVILRWLADLYVSVGDLDAAEQAYERILAFFSFDTATSNAYARFLIDVRGDAGRAERVLRDAIGWADALDEPPVAIGHTYALRARVLRALGRCAEAIEPSDRAVEMLDEDAAEEALRVRAACLAEAGRLDEARRNYAELLGSNGAANPDDVSGFIAALTAGPGRIDAGEVESAIAKAIEDARERRREAAKAEGATIVEMRTSDGVRIEGTFRRGGDLPRAVVFVPESSSRRSVYTPYAQLLSLDGISTLTVDPRGHGDSRSDSLPSFNGMSETHRARIADDIALAVRRAGEETGAPAHRIVVIAAGDGCAAVERALHEHALACSIVHLSPVFDPEDRALASALSFRQPRPSMLLVSDEDVYALHSLGYFLDRAGTNGVKSDVLTGAGHGNSLLRDPEHFAGVLTWIENALAPAD